MTLSGRHVLVVEDDTLIGLMVEDMLSDLGCVLAANACDLDEALSIANSDVTIDAALLDVNLAGNPVFPVADVLRVRGVAIVFTTGYGDGALRESDKGSPILRKPYRTGELAAALTAALACAEA